MNSSIPDTLKKDIQSLADSLKSNLNGTLKSVVLYGGLTKNDLVKDSDRVNLMVVLTEISASNLDKVGDALQASSRTQQVHPLVLSEADLKSSTDVFPIKFLDMKQDYDVLVGDDLVKDLEIGRDNLRLRCEQEIKNLMLKLRRMYMNSRNDEKALKGSLLKGYYSFLQSGDALAELKTGKVYRKESEVVDAIGSIGLDADLMKKIVAVRSDGSLGDAAQIKKTFEDFMAMIEKAAKMADEL